MSKTLSKMAYFILIFIIYNVYCVSSQNDGRYRPSPAPRIPVTRRYLGNQPSNDINDGRYRPSNDGKYRPNNEGKYRPSNDSKYVHVGDKDRGLYSGGGGQYIGNNEGYNHVGDGRRGGSDDRNVKGNERNSGSGADPITEIRIGGRNNLASTTVQPSTPKSPPIIKVSPTRRLIQSNVPKGSESGWKIIRQEQSDDENGYHYLFETENGILAEESGRIEKLGLEPEDEGLRSKGFYQYIGDDGVLYRVDYVADHNGFVPQGEHIPKTPPAIQKLLEDLAAQSN